MRNAKCAMRRPLGCGFTQEEQAYVAFHGAETKALRGLHDIRISIELLELLPLERSTEGLGLVDPGQ
jgi:hypothetical protein